MVKLSIVVLALSLGNGCLAQQGSVSAGSICGSVSRSDTHRAVGSAWISVYSVSTDKVHTSPLPPQKTAADGGFCFHSLPSAEYLLLPHKAGFVPAFVNAGGALVTDITLHSGETSQPLRLNLVPVLSVSQAPDGALRAMYTAEQRLYLTFLNGAFSPSGRYFAFQIGENRGNPEWRYDLVARQLLSVSTELAGWGGPADIAWDREVLYSRFDHGPNYFLKTEGNATTAIPSWPADLHVSDTATPRTVGPYSVDEQRAHGGGVHLLLGSREIADLNGSWASVDDPPAVVLIDTQYGGVVILDLRTLHRQLVRLPWAQFLNVLAAWRAPKELRVALEVMGPCEPPEGLGPMMIPGYTYQFQPHNLCFVDVPYKTQLSERQRAPRGK